jgi:hypothetical protein
LDGSCFIGQTAECEREEYGLGFRGMGEALAGNFLVHDAGFQEDEAHAIPIGVEGGPLQEVEFRHGRRGSRRRNWDVVLDIFCVQAVATAVAGGLLFSGGGDGSAGFGAVDARGFDLTLSSHPGNIMHEGFEAGVQRVWKLVCFVGVKNFHGL